jgi:mRNA interferase MazF
VEQAGRRPALVVQNDLGNEYAPYTVVAAITTTPQRKPYPFVVYVPAGEGNLPQDSYVICAQLLTADKSRLEQRIGALSAETMERVDTALRYELSL